MELHQILLVKDGLVVGHLKQLRDDDAPWGDAFHCEGMTAEYFEYKGRRALDVHGWSQQQIDAWCQHDPVPCV